MYSKLMIINRIGQFTMVIHKLRRIAIGFSILAVLTGCKQPSKISEIRFADNAFENCILGLGGALLRNSGTKPNCPKLSDS